MTKTYYGQYEDECEWIEIGDFRSLQDAMTAFAEILHDGNIEAFDNSREVEFRIKPKGGRIHKMKTWCEYEPYFYFDKNRGK